MELYIESLTGTCFELIVSPYETILSVKTKIQRLEGIPISQQHLIWQDFHLEDDSCLKDYGITGGCTLKLVLAMRGGPINTRRVGVDDESLHEMANYIDSSHDDFFEKLTPPPSCSGKNKQVTLLVYRDGDQLHFFRVVDRGDGTLTPFSESFSDSTFNAQDDEINDDEDDDDDDDNSMFKRSRFRHVRSSKTSRLSMAKIFENNLTATKMKQVRNKMRTFSIHERMPEPPKMKKPDRPTVVRRKFKGFVQKHNGGVDGNQEASSSLNKSDWRNSSYSSTAPNISDSVSVDICSESDDKGNLSSQFLRSDTLDEISKIYSPPIDDNLSEDKTDSLQAEPKSQSDMETPGCLYNRHDLYLRSYGLVQRSSPVLNIPQEASSTSRPKSLISNENKTKLPDSRGDTINQEPINMFKNTSKLSNNQLHLKKVSPKVTEVPKNLPETSKFYLQNRLLPNKYFNKPLLPNEQPPSLSRSQNQVFPSLHNLQSDVGKSKIQSTQQSYLKARLSASKMVESSIRSNIQELKNQHQNLSNESNHNQISSPVFGNKLSYLKTQAFKKSNNGLTNSSNNSNIPTESLNDPRTKLDTMKRQEAREVIDFINKTVDAKVLHKLVCSPVKDNSKLENEMFTENPLTKSRGNSRHAILQRMKSSGKQRNTKMTSPVSLMSSPKPPKKLLPPVKPSSKKKRCYLCGKRTGLATSYMCRCGFNFCASHRYGETHSCTFDYKAAGRKALQATNPLVRAPKLPKI